MRPAPRVWRRCHAHEPDGWARRGAGAVCARARARARCRVRPHPGRCRRRRASQEQPARLGAPVQHEQLRCAHARPRVVAQQPARLREQRPALHRPLAQLAAGVVAAVLAVLGKPPALLAAARPALQRSLAIGRLGVDVGGGVADRHARAQPRRSGRQHATNAHCAAGDHRVAANHSSGKPKQQVPTVWFLDSYHTNMRCTMHPTSLLALRPC